MAGGGRDRFGPPAHGVRRSRLAGGGRRADPQWAGAAPVAARAAPRRELPPRRFSGPRRARARRHGRAGEVAPMTRVTLGAIVAGCLIVQAFFAASEIALVAA